MLRDVPPTCYFLQYAHEPDFVIRKMLTDIEEKTNIQKDQINLIFSDNRGSTFYRQFGLNFSWYFEIFKISSRTYQRAPIERNYFKLFRN